MRQPSPSPPGLWSATCGHSSSSQQSAGLTALPEHDGFHREQEREGSIERPAMRRQILLLAGVIPGISVKAFECWDFLSSNYFDLKKLIHVT